MRKFKIIIKIVVCAILLSCLAACYRFSPPVNILQTEHSIAKGDLYAQFFGTSTVYISDGYHSIMVDGFFTRQSYFKTLLTRMKSNKKMIEASLKRADINNIDLLLVSHSHFDHALDSQATAMATDALVMGSKATLSLSPKAKSSLIDTAASVTRGDFQVSFYETIHIEKNALMRCLESFVLWSTGGSRFKDKAEVYSFYIRHPKANILIVPSAGLPADLVLPDNTDVVFLGIGLLGNQSAQYIRDYWQRAVIDTGAKSVILIHWDNFFRPLTHPIQPTPSIVDDVDRTLQLLTHLASQTQKTNTPVNLWLPPAFDRFLLH